MKVICGEMEFGDFMMGGAPTPMCIIHEVQATLDVDDDFDFDALLLKYDSYIVPEQSKHEIVYSKQPKGAAHLDRSPAQAARSRG